MYSTPEHEDPFAKFSSLVDATFSLPWESSGGIGVVVSVFLFFLFLPSFIKTFVSGNVLVSIESFGRMIIAGLAFSTLFTFFIGIWMWWNEIKSLISVGESS